MVVLALVGTWVAERTTWYLAIDQFGYLTFARDLAAGKVFHSWDAERFLGPLLPRNLAADLLAQTYIRRGGLLHCRYAPGFPLLLAAVAPLGESALRSVNLIALLGMLVCLYGVGRRLLESEWAGLCSAVLACLLPTYLLLWSISPLRDVPTHLVAFGALWLLASASAPLAPLRAACRGGAPRLRDLDARGCGPLRHLGRLHRLARPTVGAAHDRGGYRRSAARSPAGAGLQHDHERQSAALDAVHGSPADHVVGVGRRVRRQQASHGSTGCPRGATSRTRRRLHRRTCR